MRIHNIMHVDMKDTFKVYKCLRGNFIKIRTYRMVPIIYLNLKCIIYYQYCKI